MGQWCYIVESESGHSLDWIGGVCCTCIHINCICVLHACGLYGFFVFIVVVMVSIVLACEN